MYFQVDCSKYRRLPPLEERSCFRMYAPICGSDGNTYRNDCFFCSESSSCFNLVVEGAAHSGPCGDRTGNLVAKSTVL
uniref:Kazal-like domain-containing protein n=1 Tax=Rhinolophus ferrumequinum TaxID=59479 RepID=A0A671ET89_RHIFE